MSQQNNNTIRHTSQQQDYIDQNQQQQQNQGQIEEKDLVIRINNSEDQEQAIKQSEQIHLTENDSQDLKQGNQVFALPKKRVISLKPRIRREGRNQQHPQDRIEFLDSEKPLKKSKYKQELLENKKQQQLNNKFIENISNNFEEDEEEEDEEQQLIEQMGNSQKMIFPNSDIRILNNTKEVNKLIELRSGKSPQIMMKNTDQDHERNQKKLCIDEQNHQTHCIPPDQQLLESQKPIPQVNFEQRSEIVQQTGALPTEEGVDHSYQSARNQDNYLQGQQRGFIGISSDYFSQQQQQQQQSSQHQVHFNPFLIHHLQQMHGNNSFQQFNIVQMNPQSFIPLTQTPQSNDINSNQLNAAPLTDRVLNQGREMETNNNNQNNNFNNSNINNNNQINQINHNNVHNGNGNEEVNNLGNNNTNEQSQFEQRDQLNGGGPASLYSGIGIQSQSIDSQLRNQRQRNEIPPERQMMTNLATKQQLQQNQASEFVQNQEFSQQNFIPPQFIPALPIIGHNLGNQAPLPTAANQQHRQRQNNQSQVEKNKYYSFKMNEYLDTHFPDEPFMRITAMKTNQDNANNNNIYIITARGMVKSKKNTIAEDIIIGRQETTKTVDAKSGSQEQIEIRPTDIVLPPQDRAISRIHCKIIYQDGFRIPRKITDSFLLFLFSMKVNKYIIPDLALRLIWQMVRPKLAFYIVDIGSAQGTFIKIRYDKSQIIEKGQVFLIGAETQFHILDVSHSSSESNMCRSETQIEQDFYEYLLKEKKNNTTIHGLSVEQQQNLNALFNQPEKENQNAQTQPACQERCPKSFVKLKVNQNVQQDHLFILGQQAADSGFMIGRSQECTIQININTISRKQSRIFYKNGKWHLKDGGLMRESANGTWISLNDFREKNEIRNESDPKEIEDGSEIKISDSILKIEICNNELRKKEPRCDFHLGNMEIETSKQDDEEEDSPHSKRDLDMTG